jgi:hypothetical protein
MKIVYDGDGNFVSLGVGPTGAVSQYDSNGVKTEGAEENPYDQAVLNNIDQYALRVINNSDNVEKYCTFSPASSFCQ